MIVDISFYTDPEISLKKLSYVRWQKWGEEKRLAIEYFIETALVNFVLQTEDNDFSVVHHDPDSWLCAIARTEIPIEPVLKRIEQHPQALVDLYEQNSEALIKGKLSNGFWHDIPDVCQTVIDWFKSDAVMHTIERQYSIVYDS